MTNANPSGHRMTALELSRNSQLKVPATDLLKDAQSAGHFAELLVGHKHWMAAITYMAHAIPAREGIWWAWYCIRKVASPEMPPDQVEALKLAETWIAQPTEENRLKARDRSQRIDSGSGPQLLLEGIAATGELEDPISGKKVAVIPFMSSKYVNACVIGACYRPDPEHPEETANDFLRQAFEVASRIHLWSNYQ